MKILVFMNSGMRNLVALTNKLPFDCKKILESCNLIFEVSLF